MVIMDKKMKKTTTVFLLGLILLIAVVVIANMLESGAEEIAANTKYWNPSRKIEAEIDSGKMNLVWFCVVFFAIWNGIKLIVWYVKKISTQWIDSKEEEGK
jgi:Ca2+/Na+ antiporter